MNKRQTFIEKLKKDILSNDLEAEMSAVNKCVALFETKTHSEKELYQWGIDAPPPVFIKSCITDTEKKIIVHTISNRILQKISNDALTTYIWALANAYEPTCIDIVRQVLKSTRTWHEQVIWQCLILLDNFPPNVIRANQEQVRECIELIRNIMLELPWDTMSKLQEDYNELIQRIDGRRHKAQKLKHAI